MEILTQMRLDFTVMGQTVNTTSRVESLCARLNEPLLITDAVAQHLDERAGAGEFEVKGLSQPCRIFALPENRQYEASKAPQPIDVIEFFDRSCAAAGRDHRSRPACFRKHPEGHRCTWILPLRQRSEVPSLVHVHSLKTAYSSAAWSVGCDETECAFSGTACTAALATEFEFRHGLYDIAHESCHRPHTPTLYAPGHQNHRPRRYFPWDRSNLLGR